MMVRKNVEENVHVRIETPIDKRKEILQTAIYTVELLKQVEIIKKIREERLENIEKLGRTFASVNNLMRLVRIKDLPLEAEDLKHVKDVKGTKVLPKLDKARLATHETLRGLDKQLQDLKKKLESI